MNAGKHPVAFSSGYIHVAAWALIWGTRLVIFRPWSNTRPWSKIPEFVPTTADLPEGSRRPHERSITASYGGVCLAVCLSAVPTDAFV